MSCITNIPARWPRTPRRLARALRGIVDLPEVRVRAQGDLVTVTWLDGPTRRGVAADFAASRLTSGVRRSRHYSMAAVGSAMVAAAEGTDDPGRRFRAAWDHVQFRDYDTDPLTRLERCLGATLAGLAGVPADARLGWHRRRWDWEMHLTLNRLGADTIRALAP